MKDIIINFAPTGMVPTKQDNENVPINCEEIIIEVKKAYDLGITMVHLHVRNDKDGSPDYKKEKYAKIISGIRKFAPELIVCVSTSGRTYKDFDKRSEVLSLNRNLKPDMASLTLSSLNFFSQASINKPDIIKKLAMKMKENKILPELEIFDLGMVNYANYLNDKKIIKPPFYYNIILGNIASSQFNLLHLTSLVESLPKNAYFSIGGIGKNQLPSNSLAVAMGYGLRVGLEDNLWYDLEKTKIASNTDLLKRIHKIIDLNDKKAMKPSVLRKKLGLKNGIDGYGLK